MNILGDSIRQMADSTQFDIRKIMIRPTPSKYVKKKWEDLNKFAISPTYYWTSLNFKYR